jgi:hypothetical protein
MNDISIQSKINWKDK